VARCFLKFDLQRYLSGFRVASTEPRVHLTKSVIDQLRSGPKDTLYSDESLAGFGIKVTPKGRKVFIVLYRTRDGFSKLRKYTIGPYGQTTLAMRG